MIKKSFILAVACSSLIAPSALAQEEQVAKIKAQLVLKRPDKKTKRSTVTRKPLYLELISKKKLYYRTTNVAVELKEIPLSKLKAVYMARPKEYVEAQSLFKERKYAAALEAFKGVEKKYAKIAEINNSFPVLSAYNQLTCYRKLKQYGKLAEAQKAFNQSKYLTEERHKQQLEVYKFWAQLEAKAYPAIVAEYDTKWKDKKLTGSLRSQVEFIYGRALEATKKPDEAFIAYCKAMLADHSKSEVLVLEAIDGLFRLIEADKEIQEVRQFWDKGDKGEMKTRLNRTPYNRLIEAGGLVRLHNKLALSGFDENENIVELAPKIQAYLKYTRAAGEKFQ